MTDAYRIKALDEKTVQSKRTSVYY